MHLTIHYSVIIVSFCLADGKINALNGNVYGACYSIMSDFLA